MTKAIERNLHSNCNTTRDYKAAKIERCNESCLLGEVVPVVPLCYEVGPSPLLFPKRIFLEKVSFKIEFFRFKG